MNELWALPFEMAEQVLSDLASAKSNPQALVEGFPERKARGYELGRRCRRHPGNRANRQGTGLVRDGAGCRGVVVEGRACRPSARAILLDIASPAVSWRHEGAFRRHCRGPDEEALRRLRQRPVRVRRVLAGVGHGTVYAPLTATVGSIGVIMTITNYAKLEEKWGVSTVTLRAASGRRPDRAAS